MSPIGTAFAVMFAAHASVAILRRWEPLLAAALLATIWQALGLALTGDVTMGAVAVAAAFWLLYLALAVALRIRLERATPRITPSSLVLLGALLAGVASVASSTAPTKGVSCSAPRCHRGPGRRRSVPTCAPTRSQRVPRRSRPGSEGSQSRSSCPARADRRLGGGGSCTAWLARRANELKYQVVALAYLTGAFVQSSGRPRSTSSTRSRTARRTASWPSSPWP